MAPRKANTAHIEALGETMSPEETQMMEDNRAGDNAPVSEPEAAPAPEAQEQAPAAATAPKTEAQPDIDPETGKQRKVDYGAFHAERERRKTSDAELAKAREEIAKFNGRFETLQQLAKQTKAPEAEQPVPIPDVNVDPVGHFQAKSAQLERQLQDVSRWRESQEANATAMNNVQQLTRIALSHEAEFAAKTPDYQDAAGYVRSMRDQELTHMGYADPAVRQQIIQQDALQIAAQALQGGLNAAEVVYNIAKARGYQGKAPAVAPVLAPVVKSPDAQKLAIVAKGQQQASPLGNLNGGAAPEVSMESLLKMTDAEFDEATKGGKWAALMGGG